MNTSRLIATVATAAAVLVAAPSAFAAQDLSLKVDGITGENVTKGMEGTIAIGSFDWGVEAETSFTKGAGAAVGKPNPTAVTIIKRVDSTSPLFMNKIITGMSIPAMELTIRTASPTGGAPTASSRYCFTDVFLTSQKHTADTEASQEEIKFVYKAMGQSQNRAGTTQNVFSGWDVSLMKQLGAINKPPCTI